MPNGPFYPAGRYRCEIVDHGLTTAGTGTVQEAIRFLVLEGTQPAAEVTQYERTAYLPVTEKTMQYLVPKLAAIGIDGLKQLKKGDPSYKSLAGTYVEMYCKHESQPGKETREKWDVASSQGTPLEFKPIDDKALRQLDMLFGKEKKNAGSSTGGRPVAMASTAAQQQPDGNWQPSDDDVPF